MTYFSPGAVKFTERIHLHHFFFFYSFFLQSSQWKIWHTAYFCVEGREEDIILSLLLLLLLCFTAIEFCPQTSFQNMEHFRTVSILNCHSHFHITCGRSSTNWESIEKLLYTQLYAEICGTERPHSQTRNWCSCPAFIGLFFKKQTNKQTHKKTTGVLYMAPLSVYNVSNMRLNQSWT